MSGNFGGESPSPYGPRPSPPPPRNPYQSPADAKQGPQYVRLAPHRGSTIMALGITGAAMALFGGILAMSCYICFPLFLIPVGSLGLTISAWVMGRNDLAAIDAGVMDPAGRDSTMAGMIAGIVGVAILGAGALVVAGLFVLWAVMIGLEAAKN